MSLHALDKPRRLVVDEAFLSLLAITLTLVAWKAFAGRFLQRTLGCPAILADGSFINRVGHSVDLCPLLAAD
jgi:hypothetical protein